MCLLEFVLNCEWNFSYLWIWINCYRISEGLLCQEVRVILLDHWNAYVVQRVCAFGVLQISV